MTDTTDAAETPSRSIPRREGPRDILLTGFPSFVSRRLLGTLYDHEPDSTFRLLVRPDFIDAADRELERMQLDRERIHLLSGDVVGLDLGLSGTEYLELVANVTDVYHVASVWYLGADREQVVEVNVVGARNILDAAYEMQNLQRLNHFSTAFVAGDRTGVIMEDELDEGQRFRNPYEQTKFEAEQAMRAAMDHLPISIFRPSIIVGDSTTGEIDRMAGPYYLMTAIVQMPSQVPILMPGKGDKPLNLVPIDYVCEALYLISTRTDTAGKTFHLADPNPLSARKVFELVASHAGKRPPVGHVPYRITRLVMKFPYLEKLTRSPRQFVEDFNQLTIYNAINTTEALDGRLTCPPFPGYVDNLIRFIKTSDASFDIEMPAADELLG